MRAIRWLAPIVVLTSCWNFDEEFERRCRATFAGEDGGFSDVTACEGIGGGAGGSAGGGPGGGTGGGGTGGGTGGPDAGPDGGTDGGTQVDGGAMCPSRANSGCFGAGEWCWEYPRPMSNELFVAFTTRDAGGVWAAGAGPTLFHYENGIFTNHSRLLVHRDAGPFDEPAAITSVAVLNGTLFVTGERMDLLGSSPAGAFQATRMNVDWDTIGADPQGRLYGVARNSRGTLQRLATPGVNPLPFRYDPLNVNTTRIHAIEFDSNDFAYVTTGTDNQAFRFDVSALGDGGTSTTPLAVDAGIILNGAGGYLGPLARLQSGSVIMGGVDTLYGHDGTDWVDAGVIPFGGTFATAIVPSGTSLWVFGGSASSGGIAFEVNGPETQMGLTTGVYGATAAPGNDAWVVGSHGMLARVTPMGPVDWISPPRASDVRNLFVTDELVYAAQNQAILTRSGETWSEEPRLSGPTNGHTWVAVAAVAKQGGGHVLWAMDQYGTLYLDDRITSTNGQRRLDLARPVIDYLPRAAATLPLPDGGALLGFGRVILRLTETSVLNYDGGAISLGVLPDGGTPPDLFTAPIDMISGLAETSQALVVTGHMLPEQGGPSRVVVFVDGGWTQPITTPGGERLEDVTTCPNGSFVIAGAHGNLKRLDASGRNPSNVWTTQPPLSVDFASAWCGPNNETWVLTRGGDVVRFAAGTPVRERTGWGRRDSTTDPIDASTIRGNSSMVVISGGSSALLSRPLCPPP